MRYSTKTARNKDFSVLFKSKRCEYRTQCSSGFYPVFTHLIRIILLERLKFFPLSVNYQAIMLVFC